MRLAPDDQVVAIAVGGIEESDEKSEQPGQVGVWLLVAGVGLSSSRAPRGLWSVRLVKRSRSLNERLTSEQAQLQADSNGCERRSLKPSPVEAIPQALRWLRTQSRSRFSSHMRGAGAGR